MYSVSLAHTFNIHSIEMTTKGHHCILAVYFLQLLLGFRIQSECQMWNSQTTRVVLALCSNIMYILQAQSCAYCAHFVSKRCVMNAEDRVGWQVRETPAKKQRLQQCASHARKQRHNTRKSLVQTHTETKNAAACFFLKRCFVPLVLFDNNT